MAAARTVAWLCILLATALLRADLPAPVPSEIHPCGPGQIPRRLKGTWKVSLCCRSMHAWIRYENLQTGEVHTLSRFKKGAGDQQDFFDGRWLPPVGSDGLWWDQDMRHEGSVRNGRYLMVSVVQQDPWMYLGDNGGWGYRLPGKCCSTYAADAWYFYSGERYGCGLVGWPRRLAFEVWRRHPEIPLKFVIGEE